MELEEFKHHIVHLTPESCNLRREPSEENLPRQRWYKSPASPGTRMKPQPANILNA
jgi:hypothetical protein